MTPELFVRLPRFRAPFAPNPVIPKDRRAESPALHDDFAVLDEEVAAAFTAYDLEALADQNSHACSRWCCCCTARPSSAGSAGCVPGQR